MVTNGNYILQTEEYEAEEKTETRKLTTFSEKRKVLLAKALKPCSDIRNQVYNNIIHNFTENITVETYRDAVEALRKTNLFWILNIDAEPYDTFNCLVIEGNKATISPDKDSNFRYFSENESETVMFDVIDIFQAIFNVNYYEAIGMLCKKCNITVKEGEWVLSQKIKIADGLIKIEQREEEMRIRYPGLYNYAGKHMYILREAYLLGLAGILTNEECIEGNSIFYLSTRHLARELKKNSVNKDFTTVNRLLNMFCVLGLIRKISNFRVPTHMRINAQKDFNKKKTEMDERKTEAIKNGHKPKNESMFAMISFYYIPEMNTETLIEAERRAIMLNMKKITPYKLSADIVRELFGYITTAEVYGDNMRATNKLLKKRNKKENGEDVNNEEAGLESSSYWNDDDDDEDKVAVNSECESYNYLDDDNDNELPF